MTPAQQQQLARQQLLQEHPPWQVGTSPNPPTQELSVLRRSKRLENAQFMSLYNTNRSLPSTPNSSTPRRVKLHLRGPKLPPPSKKKGRTLASSRSLKTLPKKKRNSKKRTQISTALQAQIEREQTPAPPYRAPEAEINLNFGLPNPTLGYLTVDISSCRTPGSFWDHAAMGFNVLGGDEFRTKNAGAIVDIQGVMWPVVVPWRSTKGWEDLMGVLHRTRYGKRGTLEVYVDCVMRI